MHRSIFASYLFLYTHSILRWLVTAKLITPGVIKQLEYQEDLRSEGLLSLTSSLLSVSLNPFNATRLLSLVESIHHQRGADNSSAMLMLVMNAVERDLAHALSNRDLSGTPLYREVWPLLRGLLRVNLLPFVLIRNLELIIEVGAHPTCPNSPNFGLGPFL